MAILAAVLLHTCPQRSASFRILCTLLCTIVCAISILLLNISEMELVRANVLLCQFCSHVAALYGRSSRYTSINHVLCVMLV